MPLSPKLFRRLGPVSIAFACLLGITGCHGRKEAAKQDEEGRFFKGEPEHVEHIHRNQLSKEPSDFLRSRTDDAINWQGWSPSLFDDAKREQRLVFAVVTSSKFTETNRLFDLFRQRPKLVERLNSQYVCTLIDIDVHPEMGLNLADLSTEIKRPVSFPGIVWFSHEGSPVAWLPLTRKDIDSFDEVFDSSEVMVARIWKDSPRYVVVNSSQDDQARAERFHLDPAEDTSIEALRDLTRRSARKLASLYDPTTETMDGTGGLLPGNLLVMAGVIGQSPIADDMLRDPLLRLTRGLSSTLNRSAVRDPLDRGFFAARRSTGWSIPTTLKSAEVQCDMATAYAQSAGWTQQPELLQIAREVMNFADLELASGGNSIGNYLVLRDDKLGEHALFWSRERIRDLLPEEEFEVIEKAYGISGLGNVPLESDPRRDYFRKNTLAEKLSTQEVADALEMEPDRVSELLASGRKILRAKRRELIERNNLLLKDETRITSVNANYASALARMTRFTGEEKYLSKAQAVLAYLRAKHYSESDGLVRIGTVEGRRMIRARGIDYSALINALFEVYRVDLDPSHLVWAHALAEEAIANLSTDEGLLSELPLDEVIFHTPIHSVAMVFGQSTWGSIYGPLERLDQLTGAESLRECADQIRAHLIPLVETTPITHTDFLMGSLVPLADTVVLLEGNRGESPLEELHQTLLEPQHDGITILHVTEGLPAPLSFQPTGTPGATVVTAGNEVGKATTPEELRKLLPGGGA